MDIKANYLDETEIDALNMLVKTSKKQYEMEQIILFGSKSRGDHSDYSDIDLLVITKNKLTPQELDAFFEICSSVNVDYGVAISCLVVNQKEWINEENINPALKSNVTKEGVNIAV